MTDLVTRATLISSLDASNFQQGAEQMAESSDRATASVTRLETATVAAGRNTILTERGLRRLAESVDPSARAYNRFTADVERLNSFQSAGFKGTDIEIAQRGLQLAAIRSLSGGLRSLGPDMEAVASATTRGHVAASTATREFRALFDEISSGRTRQTPGTLAIIATRVLGINLATIAWGVGLAAIPVAMGAAAISVGNALDGIDRKLRASGFAAGVTRDQILSIAESLGNTTNLSTRGALDAAGILAARGTVQGGLLQTAVAASGGFALATGLSEDKAAKKLEEILRGPAKGAKELADQFSLLSEKQIRQIQDLEESGRAQEAQKIIIDAVNERFGGLHDASWSLAKTFDNVGKFVSDIWFNTGKKLSEGATLAQKELQLAQLRSLPVTSSRDRERIAQLRKEISDELAKSIRDSVAARTGQQTAERNRLGIQLAPILDSLNPFDAQLRKLENDVKLINEGHAKGADGVKTEAEAAKALAAVETQRQKVLREQRDEIRKQGEEYRRVKETFDGFLVSLRQEAHVAGLSAVEREKEAALIKAAQISQKERNVAERDFVRDVQGAVGELGKVRSLQVENAVEAKIAGGIVSKQVEQMTELVAALGASRNERSLAVEIAKQEFELDRKLTDQERARTKAIQDLNDARSFQDIVENLQSQNELGSLFGDQLERERQILEAIKVTHNGINDAQADGLRSLIDKNKELRDQAKILDGINGSLKSFFNTAIGGKFDFKSLVGGILSPIREKVSGDLADFVTGGLFQQKNVAVKGSGVISSGAAQGLLGSFFGGKVPKGTITDPMFVQVAGVGSIAGSFTGAGGGLSSGGLFGSGGIFGSSGFFHNLFNGGGGAGSLSAGILSLFSGFFADGGTIPAGQFGIVGESGPEIGFGGSTGMTVVPFSSGPSISSASNDNRTNSFTIVQQIDARGASPGIEEKIAVAARRAASQAVREHAPAIVSASVQAVSNRNYVTGKGTL